MDQKDDHPGCDHRPQHERPDVDVLIVIQVERREGEYLEVFNLFLAYQTHFAKKNARHPGHIVAQFACRFDGPDVILGGPEHRMIRFDNKLDLVVLDVQEAAVAADSAVRAALGGFAVEKLLQVQVEILGWVFLPIVQRNIAIVARVLVRCNKRCELKKNQKQRNEDKIQ